MSTMTDRSPDRPADSLEPDLDAINSPADLVAGVHSGLIEVVANLDADGDSVLGLATSKASWLFFGDSDDTFKLRLPNGAGFYVKVEQFAWAEDTDA